MAIQENIANYLEIFNDILFNVIFKYASSIFSLLCRFPFVEYIVNLLCCRSISFNCVINAYSAAIGARMQVSFAYSMT